MSESQTDSSVSHMIHKDFKHLHYYRQRAWQLIQTQYVELLVKRSRWLLFGIHGLLIVELVGRLTRQRALLQQERLLASEYVLSEISFHYF